MNPEMKSPVNACSTAREYYVKPWLLKFFIVMKVSIIFESDISF
jgi:hypothetical protein